MANYLDEYLVKIGSVVDTAGMRNFENALTHAKSVATFNLGSMASAILKTETAAITGFAAMGMAAVGFVDKVAEADQQYRLFAMHMFMSKDAARGLKVAMDALGQPLENIMWDPELNRRAKQLMEDQRRMAPGQDFNQNMRMIRDLHFEVTRFEVELQYLGMNVVNKFLEALGMGPSSLLQKLQQFNDWFITKMPHITDVLVKDFLPVWHDIVKIGKDAWQIFLDIGSVFERVIGLFSGDENLKKGIVTFENMANAVGKVAHALAWVVDKLTAIFGFIAGLSGGSAIGGVIGGAIGGLAGPEGIIPGALAGAQIGGSVGAAGGAGFDLWRFLHPGRAGLGFGGGPNLPSMSVAQLTALIPLLERSGANSVSPKGARGIYQIMPGTGAALGMTSMDDYTNPDRERMFAMKYLAQLSQQYGGNTAAILAAYNGGGYAARNAMSGNFGALPRETQDYLNRADRIVHNNQITVNIGGTNATPMQITNSVAQGVQNGLATNRNQTAIATAY